MASARSLEHALVGVRLTGSSEIIFCKTGVLECSVGDCVHVDWKEFGGYGRVVVAANRWKGVQGPINPGVLRTVTADELEAYLSSNADLSPPRVNAPDFGSTGQGFLNSVTLANLANGAISMEDDRSRRAKRALPSLGQPVCTPGGDASVVAVDVLRRSVTCTMNFDASEITQSADDLTWHDNQAPIDEDCS